MTGGPAVFSSTRRASAHALERLVKGRAVSQHSIDLQNVTGDSACDRSLLGCFLADPLELPHEVLDGVAAQVGSTILPA
ncbi:hypothetical protein [Nonomuraea diastatica]|uniref:Uncharacterized protein n=1 Tax=Nonomuraea diastatica TaxID=1848329 RepID=A0A4R4WDQ7_9ACTN|nr:hypothetical protein [Nonomuraea diastatica]TDD14363.1 hypothetical protein E1294_37780 [Nonomuraea diastatica]